MAPRTPTIPQSTDYFAFEPSSCEVSPLKPRKTNVRCLDAFHERPGPSFDLPSNASLYIRRALPPLPPPLSALPALHQCTSSDSLYSGQSSRPSTAMTHRQSQSCEKPLPRLPLHQRCPSLESIYEPGDAENSQSSRPRAGRSTSFRGLFHRHSASSPSTDDLTCSMSSMGSYESRAESRADSVVGDLALTQVATNHTAKRRPSALSLSQLRSSSKKTKAAPPPLPLRPRKFSTSTRWNPFGRNSMDDKEDIPPMPVTPPFVQELNFTQCYYWFARNCHGYVLSNGDNGDACENCAGAGYLGSP